MNSSPQSRLRGAVRRHAVDPALRLRLQETLAQNARRQRLAERRGLAAMALVTAAVLGLLWVIARGKPWPVVDAALVNRALATLPAPMALAVGTHVECALLGNTRTVPIPGLRFAPPDGYTLADAHRCLFRDRAWTHFVFRRQRHLLSVLLARRLPGEELRPMVQATFGPFHSTALSTTGQTMFVVSDLSGSENVLEAKGIWEQVMMRK